MNPRPGEVWLADLGLAPRALIIYVPLTTQNRQSSYEGTIPKQRFLDRDSVANVQGLGSLPKVRLERKLGTLSNGVTLSTETIGDSDMAKSRTYKTSGLPGVVAPHYHVTKISEGGKSRSGAGRTAEESQRKAAKNWEKAKKR